MLLLVLLTLLLLQHITNGGGVPPTIISLHLHDRVIVSSTTTSSSSITVLTDSKRHIHKLTPSTVLACLPAGEESEPSVDLLLSSTYDTIRDARYGFLAESGSSKNSELSTEAIRHVVRKLIWEGLRNGRRIGVDAVVAGCDELFYVDNTGSSREVPFCVHGVSSHFLLGLLDEEFNVGMSEGEAVKLIERCFEEVGRRWGAGGGGGGGADVKKDVVVIDASGVRQVK